MSSKEQFELYSIFEPYLIFEIRKINGKYNNREYLREDAPKEVREAYKKHQNYITSDKYEPIR
ncbi:MAG: hypothetical protein Q3988_04480 [Gemella sp.]|nr:hypothetical protein [Gemella sp.]